jgi:tRNA threonylcarbamoyl adenosine modification protein YeaZ
MIILAFDTCLAACSATVIERSITGRARVLARRFQPMATGHAEALMPMISEVLDEAALTVATCDAIAVSVGPGTFTGVRVGVAAARGLALASGKPVLTATSLALIAAEAGPGTMRIGVAADARNGQVHFLLVAADGVTPHGPPLLLTAPEAVRRIGVTPIRLRGSAAGSLAAAIESRVVVEAHAAEPDSGAFAHVSLTPADPPMPLYLREPDAKPQIGKSLPRVAT